MSRVHVRSEREYDVLIGEDWRALLPHLCTGRKRVALVYSKATASLLHPIPKLPAEVTHIEIEDGENGKSPQSLLTIIEALGAGGFTRSDVVVAIGGGAVTDIAGFAAATWLRGVDWISIPTTVAGAVDAAIGGKTGANTAHGKNLFGAFHSPTAVIVDLSWFETLSDRDYAAGLAEVVKCGFIKDASILDLIEGKSLQGIRSNPVVVEYLVRKAVTVKAVTVSKDFRESKEREILNYGHTLGHAIEQSSGYRLRHGECVSIGMVFAAELAAAQNFIEPELVDRHRTILQSLGLPISYDRDQWSQLEPLLWLDKKSRGSTLRFVLLTGLGETIRYHVESSDELRATYEKVSS